MEFGDELHYVFNTYVHNNGKRLTLLHRVPGLAIDNEMAITLEMYDDFTMIIKYKVPVVDQTFFVGGDLWIQAYTRHISGTKDKKTTKFKYFCYNVSESSKKAE